MEKRLRLCCFLLVYSISMSCSAETVDKSTARSEQLSSKKTKVAQSRPTGNEAGNSKTNSSGIPSKETRFSKERRIRKNGANKSDPVGIEKTTEKDIELLRLAQNEHWDGVHEYIDNGGDADIEDPTCKTDGTLLHIAARFGKAEIIRKILRTGVNVNKKNLKGMTPLHYATRYNHFEAVKVLVENGADIMEETNWQVDPAVCTVPKIPVNAPRNALEFAKRKNIRMWKYLKKSLAKGGHRESQG